MVAYDEEKTIISMHSASRHDRPHSIDSGPPKIKMKIVGSRRRGACLPSSPIFPREYLRILSGHSDHFSLKPSSNFSSLRTDQVYW